MFLRAIPKQKTPRDKKYKKWLLVQTCTLRDGRCFGDMIYHHTATGGMGLTGSDYEAIPVCFYHHEKFNNASKKGKGLFSEGELQQIIKNLHQKYIKETGREIINV